jgi:UDP-N-acetylglucosamine 2-epimerase
MSDAFFAELKLPEPSYNLGINGCSHGVMTGRMLEKIEEILLAEKPDMLLVYGDTNSTLAGALAAVKLHVPVAHVEAGLRCGNMNMPEEINRILTDRVSKLLFCPTEAAVRNLEREGIGKNVFHVGDVMYDAHLFHCDKLVNGLLAITKYGIHPKDYILTTLHRAENTNHLHRLRAIMNALTTLSKKMPVVFPVHPRTKKALEKANLYDRAQQHLQLLPPIGYEEMLNFQQHAALILTDSGGVQKEAYFAKVPCVTLRDETEWIELIECGCNILVSPESKDIVKMVEKHLSVWKDTQPFDDNHLYGDGYSAARIIDHICAFI